MKAFELFEEWPAETVAAAVIAPSGDVLRHGDTSQVFSLASITKLFTAAAVLVGIEEGSLELDTAIDERDATVADMLSHASGLAPNGTVLDEPGRRRIYSNSGYEQLAHALETATEMPFRAYLTEGVFKPLGMHSTDLTSSPAFGAESSVDDLVAFIGGLGTLLDPTTVAAMTSIHLPELIGVLPGYGRQAPNPWGLGPEIRGSKTPHWTGERNSVKTWGHFGQAGTFLWVDPEAQISCIVLTDLPFDEWAKPRWPVFSDFVHKELLG